MTKSSETGVGELRNELRALLDAAQSPALRSDILARYYTRTVSLIETLLPRLYAVRLPVSPQTRQTVRAMQELLDLVARSTLDSIGTNDPSGEGVTLEFALSRVFYALSRHLMLSDLLAAPASQGIWFQLHRAYLVVRAHGMEHTSLVDSNRDFQAFYGRTLALGAIPGVGLTAQQWSFMDRFLAQTKAVVSLSDTPPLDASPGILWLAPEQDMPPMHLSRRQATGNALTLYVDITALIDELVAFRDSLEQSHPPRGLLPDDISPRLAQITLTNSLGYLSQPRKRHFSRRRQTYRATLCCGLTEVLDLLNGHETDVETANEWMVINESPGGFAAMHVSGRPQKVQVGDLVGLKQENESVWSICIARWALSENQEHLELGLQMIASNPVVVRMATPGAGSSAQHTALLLPATPPLRPLDALAFLPANHPAPEQKHLLVIDGPKVEVREFVLGELIEQSPSVDIRLIHSGARAGI